MYCNNSTLQRMWSSVNLHMGGKKRPSLCCCASTHVPGINYMEKGPKTTANASDKTPKQQQVYIFQERQGVKLPLSSLMLKSQRCWSFTPPSPQCLCSIGFAIRAAFTTINVFSTCSQAKQLLNNAVYQTSQRPAWPCVCASTTGARQRHVGWQIIATSGFSTITGHFSVCLFLISSLCSTDIFLRCSKNFLKHSQKCGQCFWSFVFFVFKKTFWAFRR